ncbi:membrane protein insertion efficiency factor YidD [Zooshikella ganghwensis]|uniref:Membrane protein insertion efficiency factor YidD n=1 Tax=Zooshikella ganghwensis TaxID=202772 RepID=A0A4P9VQ31_9GAMM|nr:membrane protein insertion efficiency factor YidD [Zooshikella ganghwensis]
MLKSFLVLLIEIYQKYISPYKGYRCAHGVFYKGDSCSCAVRKVIQRRGLIRGYSDIRNQFARCSYAYERLEEEKDKKRTIGWQIVWSYHAALFIVCLHLKSGARVLMLMVVIYLVIVCKVFIISKESNLCLAVHFSQN